MSEVELNQDFDVIIIGAGAAGLMCAIEAGKRGRKTLVLEHNKNVGDKIRISGGGKCNFTNLQINRDNYLSKNPYFAISALTKYSNFDFINFVEKNEIKYHEKTLGQLFCDDSSKQIINMLVSECEKNDVNILTKTKVIDIEKTNSCFVTKTETNNINSKSVVIASGALSIPKMGATDLGYKIAKNFNLAMVDCEPALVPFTIDESLLSKTALLAGVSNFVEVSCNKKSFRENILFTHRGISGPAILQISSYWNKGDIVTINFLPDIQIYHELIRFKTTSKKQSINKILAQFLPKKLAEFFCEYLKVNGFISEISNKKLLQIADTLNNFKFVPNGTEGYAKAEVTRGGVSTDEICAKTFETKKVKGLYFIGEVLDVTGHLGGYNFQWAWSSGYAAGLVV
ncbi:MAG: NAD(P)/FAD-dependent oxidoreductase [Rickettsiales bacterium]|nr:NAD(P)/FAD-dependent oxidoreductase [Rickettsiales bacterium]